MDIMTLIALDETGNRFSKDGMTDLRYCCNPGKLLGSLPFDLKDWSNLGRSRMIQFLTKDGGRAEVELHVLSIGFRTGYAFKSNDKPMEFFRNIQGFKEAK